MPDDAALLLSGVELIIGCMISACPFGIVLAHKFPIFKRIIKIKET